MTRANINLLSSTPFVQLAAFVIKCGPASKTQALPPEGDTIVLTNVANKITDSIWVTLGADGAAPTAFYGVGYEVNGGSSLVLARPPGIKSIACIGKEPNTAKPNPDAWVLYVECGSRLVKPPPEHKPEPNPTDRDIKH